MLVVAAGSNLVNEFTVRSYRRETPIQIQGISPRQTWKISVIWTGICSKLPQEHLEHDLQDLVWDALEKFMRHSNGATLGNIEKWLKIGPCTLIYYRSMLTVRQVVAAKPFRASTGPHSSYQRLRSFKKTSRSTLRAAL